MESSTTLNGNTLNINSVANNTYWINSNTGSWANSGPIRYALSVFPPLKSEPKKIGGFFSKLTLIKN